ncbi:hypothetical protein B9Z55_017707 [Caenorhabditis nigoni]|nr:hypothetical protein B9Z55_017707 [Caenorhabditis nigoni]
MFGPYKYIVNSFTILGMIFAIVDIIVYPITAPTIILFTPVFIIILLPFFDLSVSIPSGPFLGLFTLYPAMDSIIVMYVVSQYRQTAKKLYQDFRKALDSFKQARATVHYAIPRNYFNLLQPQPLTVNYPKPHMADKEI